MLIAHLSDPHLRPRGVLYQDVVDSNAMFEAAIRHLDRLEITPDLVILSGDLVDTGHPDEYEVARDLLARISLPLLAIPGNHDEREAFRAAFRDRAWMATEGPLHLVGDAFGPVRVIGLDATLPGEHHGNVDEAAADWLAATLATDPQRPTIIMMHQPPIATGVPYLDAYRCFGAARLEAVVSRFPGVELILCGHVHRMMQTRFAGTLLMTAPSTTTAIALKPWAGADPASHVEPPALLRHHWRPGAGMLTHVVPIGDFPGPFDFA